MAMAFPPTTLERAFEIARSGTCRQIGELKRRLQHEGYDVRQIDGPRLLQQLRELMTAADPAP